MPEGRIIKALSGFYYVRDQGGELWQCRARGIFKKREITPLVGDWVEFDEERNQEGFITSIQKRSTELVRPPIANADQAVLVFSLKDPPLSLLLLDRFLVHTESCGLRSVICLSKLDLVKDYNDEVEKVYGRMGYPVIIAGKGDDEATEQVRRQLRGHITVFAGQSGVGKSTLLNRILPQANLLTGDISVRLGRGRHTTRHVELHPVEHGLVADTPGFSQLDFFDVEPQQLSSYFLDMKPLVRDCKFRGCLHIGEPQCAVCAALEAGELAQSRYNHYKQFIEEIKNKKRRY
jgi:ribosome biogenesis GTPase